MFVKSIDTLRASKDGINLEERRKAFPLVLSPPGQGSIVKKKIRI